MATQRPKPERVDPIKEQLRTLTAQVDRLESAYCVTAALTTGLALVLGTLLPYVSYTEDNRVVTQSVLGFGVAGFVLRDSDGGSDPVGTAFGVAFVGLTVVTAVAIAALVMIGRRSGREKHRIWMAPAAVVLDIGVIGMWITVLLAARGKGFALHSGPFFLSAGAVAVSVLVFNRAVRRWWQRDVTR